MDRARDWGVRIAHEVSLHEESSFLTLTYSDEHLPDDYSVSVRAVQLFNKRLRKAIAPSRFRFYACGEYGDLGQRPHYHSIIFGYSFPDKVLWRRTRSGYFTYRSPLLESVWPFGHAEIGTVTRTSGAYVARYCLKKRNGARAGEYYRRLHPLTGEVVDVRPEFAVMSSRPGVGFGWIEQWESDCFPSNFVVVNGEKFPVPKYYRKRLRDRYEFPAYAVDARLMEHWLDSRHVAARRGKEWLRDHPEGLTKDRLAVREELQLLKQAKIERDG